MKHLPFPDHAESLLELTGDFGRFTSPLTIEGQHAFAKDDALSVSITDTLDDEGVCLRCGNLTAQKPLSIDGICWIFEQDGSEYDVYTQFNSWQNESLGAWQPLQTGVCAEGSSARSGCGAVPFLAIWNRQTSRGRVFHLLCDGAWQMKASHVYLDGVNTRLRVSLGHAKGHFSLALARGQTQPLPKLISYEIKNKLDLDAYKLHRFFHHMSPPRHLPVIFNTWMSCFDQLELDFVTAQIEKAAALGVEYFVIDAGWFGRGDFWWESVGDWEENRTTRLRGQLKLVSQRVRAAGMKFGFWLETERAHQTTKAYADHPEFFIKAGEHCLLNFADRAAREQMLEKVVSLVRTYEADFLKLDFNVDFYNDPSATGFLRYAEGYRAFIQGIRAALPGIYLEGCASGGMRMTFKEAELFDSFWPSDCQSPVTGLRICTDTVRRLPPCLIDRWASVASLSQSLPVYPGHDQEKIIASHDATWNELIGVHPDFLQGFLSGGPLGFSCDLTAFSPALFARMKQLVADFKQDRAFWQKAECHILCDTPQLTILQYADEEEKELRIQAFSLRCMQKSVRVYPVLTQAGEYLVDGAHYTAAQLTEDGISISLPDSHRMTSLHLYRVMA